MQIMDSKQLVKEIHELARRLVREVRLMEVCGSHTQAINRFGIRQVMPQNVKLTTGPGCPVCVLANEEIEDIVKLAQAGIPIASYGDVLRLKGRKGSLDDARSQGAKIFPVYSVEDALELKKKYQQLIFFAYGFETTAPMTAVAAKKGLIIYTAHKLFIPAMAALLKVKEAKIDGFIAPGHVSAITGSRVYKDLAVPLVITGFECIDVLVGIYKLLRQLYEGRSETENEYLRVVRPEGNPKAYKMIFDVFNVTPGKWRGLGVIKNSGLDMKDKYKKFNAKIIYRKLLAKKDNDFSVLPNKCLCEKIILGIKEPQDCPLFKKTCLPENPQGACMVSVEGSCNVASYY
jgi:hydrogenase expression/formation protein HypD